METVIELIANRMNELIKIKDRLICSDFDLRFKDKKLRENKEHYILAAGIYVDLFKDDAVRVTVDDLLNIYNRSELKQWVDYI